MAAHVHIGRPSRSTTYRPLATGVLLDKGTARCPCELDIAFSQIASYLQDEGPGARVFIDPTEPGVSLQLDIALHQMGAGCPRTAELLLPRCRPGTVRMVELPELLGDEARITIRCSSVRGARVRISANEPRYRPNTRPALVIGGA